MVRNNSGILKTANSSIQKEPKTSTPAVTKLKKNILYFIECSEGIDSSHVEIIENKMSKVAGDLLYLVIHTRGGDVYSAVRIMRILQSKFKKIQVIIPDYAYSSGTIMSLGGDEIWMAVDASLGPLDKPLEHPSDGTTISSLDVTQTLTNLASICNSTAAEIYRHLRQDDISLKLPKSEAAKLAYDTATKIINPIVGKIDPYNLQRGYRETKIGLYYAFDMLLTRMMPNNPRQAMKTSHKLVNDFPSHGYCIFRDEVKSSLNLNVFHLETMQQWAEIEPAYIDLKKKYTKLVEYSVI